MKNLLMIFTCYLYIFVQFSGEDKVTDNKRGESKHFLENF